MVDPSTMEPPPVSVPSPVAAVAADRTRALRLGPICLVVSGAVLYSTKSLFAKSLMGDHLDPGLLLALRLLWALPLYLVVVLVVWIRRRPSASDILWSLGLGVLGFFLAPRLNFEGLGRMSTGLERILVQSSTAFVLLFASVARRRWPKRALVAAVFVCYAGMALAVSGRDEGRPFADPWGVLEILAGAAAWSLFILGIGRFQSRLGSTLTTSLGMASAAIAAAAEILVEGRLGELAQPRREWIPAMSGLVVFATIIPSFLSQSGLAKMGAVRSSILALVGPALLPFLAAWFLGESMSWPQAVGLSVVIASCAAMAINSSGH